MAYEATAELYKREYELAKKRAKDEYDSLIAKLATQYREANRGVESNLESRGILRSGEGMRARVQLGAAEKAAQLEAINAQEEKVQNAGLRYMQQLAELQAKGFTGDAPGATTPGTTSPGGGSGTTPPGSTRPPAANRPATPPAATRPVEPTPAPAPSPRLPTVGGTPVPPGQTPTETRPPAPGTVGGGAAGPTPPNQPRPPAASRPPGPAPKGYRWVKRNNNWVLEKIPTPSGGGGGRGVTIR